MNTQESASESIVLQEIAALHNSCEFEQLGIYLQNLSIQRNNAEHLPFAIAAFILAERWDLAEMILKLFSENEAPFLGILGELKLLTVLKRQESDKVLEAISSIEQAGVSISWLQAFKEALLRDENASLAEIVLSDISRHFILKEINQTDESGGITKAQFTYECRNCKTIGKYSANSFLTAKLIPCHGCYRLGVIDWQSVSSQLPFTEREEKVRSLMARVKHTFASR